VKSRLSHLLPCECPICAGDVPMEIIMLRTPFDCPCCGKALKVSGGYELAIRLIALAVGFLLALGTGLDGLLTFCVGVMIWPFLILPIWRSSIAFKKPSLVPYEPAVTTLNLTGR
jgi:hypothetical protein